MGFRNDDYIEVGERIQDFKKLYPEGTLQPVDPLEPYKVLEVGDKTFLVYTAAAFRTPDDSRPGIGVAAEPFPGTTNFTRNSELQNAETSAWGRAIVALGMPSNRKIASAEDVRNREAEREAEGGSGGSSSSGKSKAKGSSSKPKDEGGNGEVATAEALASLEALAATKGRDREKVLQAAKRHADYEGPWESMPAKVVEAITAGLSRLKDAEAPAPQAPAESASAASEGPDTAAEGGDAPAVDPETGEVVPEAPDDEPPANDFDERMAKEGKRPASDNQTKRLNALLRLRGIPEETWRDHLQKTYGFNSRGLLSFEQASAFIKWVERWGADEDEAA